MKVCGGLVYRTFCTIEKEKILRIKSRIHKSIERISQRRTRKIRIRTDIYHPPYQNRFRNFR